MPLSDHFSIVVCIVAADFICQGKLIVLRISAGKEYMYIVYKIRLLRQDTVLIYNYRRQTT